MSDWVSSGEAIKKIGVSRDTLYRWIATKVLKKGKHYRNVGFGKRATYQFHLKRIEKLFD